MKNLLVILCLVLVGCGIFVGVKYHCLRENFLYQSERIKKYEVMDRIRRNTVKTQKIGDKIMVINHSPEYSWFTAEGQEEYRINSEKQIGQYAEIANLPHFGMLITGYSEGHPFWGKDCFVITAQFEDDTLEVITPAGEIRHYIWWWLRVGDADLQKKLYFQFQGMRRFALERSF